MAQKSKSYILVVENECLGVVLMLSGRKRAGVKSLVLPPLLWCSHVRAKLFALSGDQVPSPRSSTRLAIILTIGQGFHSFLAFGVKFSLNYHAPLISNAHAT